MVPNPTHFANNVSAYTALLEDIEWKRMPPTAPTSEKLPILDELTNILNADDLRLFPTALPLHKAFLTSDLMFVTGYLIQVLRPESPRVVPADLKDFLSLLGPEEFDPDYEADNGPRNCRTSSLVFTTGLEGVTTIKASLTPQTAVECTHPRLMALHAANLAVYGVTTDLSPDTLPSHRTPKAHFPPCTNFSKFMSNPTGQLPFEDVARQCRSILSSICHIDLSTFLASIATSKDETSEAVTAHMAVLQLHSPSSGRYRFREWGIDPTRHDGPKLRRRKQQQFPLNDEWDAFHSDDASAAPVDPPVQAGVPPTSPTQEGLPRTTRSPAQSLRRRENLRRAVSRRLGMRFPSLTFPTALSPSLARREHSRGRARGSKWSFPSRRSTTSWTRQPGQSSPPSPTRIPLPIMPPVPDSQAILSPVPDRVITYPGWLDQPWIPRWPRWNRLVPPLPSLGPTLPRSLPRPTTWDQGSQTLRQRGESLQRGDSGLPGPGPRLRLYRRPPHLPSWIVRGRRALPRRLATLLGQDGRSEEGEEAQASGFP